MLVIGTFMLALSTLLQVLRSQVMKYSLYIALNVFFFLVSLYVLLYVNTYLNGYIVPFRAVGIFRSHQTIAAILHVAIVVFEALVLNLCYYGINWLMLTYDYQSKQPKRIALRTAAINIGLVLCILGYGGLYTYFH